MSDVNQNPLHDGSIPVDADFGPDVVEEAEAADLLPGGSPMSGDATEESRDEIKPEEGVATP